MPLPNSSTTLASSFLPLELHSHFTLLGATSSVEQLVERATVDGLSHLALTDSNVLYGAISFDQACREAGIQPILGMVVSVTDSAAGAMVEKTPTTKDGIPVEPASDIDHGRLILLATGSAGYRSLCQLSSHLQAQPDRQGLGQLSLGWEELASNNEGLICLTGGRRDRLYQLLKDGDQVAASRYVARLGGLYDENAYLALELRQPADTSIARQIRSLSQRFGLPTVALQPVYYLEQASSPQLQLLQAIGQNCRLEEVTQDFSGYHWLSPTEMADRFAEFPESLDQIGQISRRCQAALPDGRPIWPRLELPQGQTPAETLATAADEGMLALYGPTVAEPVRRRLNVELAAIAHSGLG